MDTADRLRAILENHPGIRQAVVFGSVASGKANPGSDLDIAIEAEHPLSAAQRMRLIEDLAAAIGRPVDLIDLKTVGEPLLGQILQHGQRILGSNTDYAALIRRHLFDAEDFLPYAQRMLHERKRAWTG
jgi:predicted nucleotidyltransferase